MIYMDKQNGPRSLGSITFVAVPQAGSTFQINKPIIKIGREPVNDIVVSEPSVSREHAQITQNNGAWTIKNLTDRNRVAVNYRDVPPSQQAAINERDMIMLGSGTVFQFHINTEAFNAPNAPAFQPPSIVPQVPPLPPQQQPVQGSLPPAMPQQQTFQAIPPSLRSGTDQSQRPQRTPA